MTNGSQPATRIARRRILAGFGALAVGSGAGLLAGCDSGGTTATAPPSRPSTGTQTPSIPAGLTLPEGWSYVAGPAPAPATEPTPTLPATITDGTGSRVEVKDLSKIIVAGDGIAAILGSLGLAGKIIAAPTAARAPEATAAPQRFEFTKETGAEGLLAMNGTLFIGDNIQRHGAVAKQFRDAGTTAIVVDDQLPLGEKITTLASYVGLSDAGAKLAADLAKNFADAKTKVGANGQPVRAIEITSTGAGGQPAVAGRGTPGAEVIAALGATSIGVEANLRRYSREMSGEALLGSAPNLILVTVGDLVAWPGGKGLWEAFPTLQQTPAGQSRRVVVMPDAQLVYDNPAIGTGALALAQHLVDHPIGS